MTYCAVTETAQADAAWNQALDTFKAAGGRIIRGAHRDNPLFIIRYVGDLKALRALKSAAVLTHRGAVSAIRNSPFGCVLDVRFGSAFGVHPAHDVS